MELQGGREEVLLHLTQNIAHFLDRLGRQHLALGLLVMYSTVYTKVV